MLAEGIEESAERPWRSRLEGLDCGGMSEEDLGGDAGSLEVAGEVKFAWVGGTWGCIDASDELNVVAPADGWGCVAVDGNAADTADGDGLIAGAEL